MVQESPQNTDQYQLDQRIVSTALYDSKSSPLLNEPFNNINKTGIMMNRITPLARCRMETIPGTGKMSKPTPAIQEYRSFFSLHFNSSLNERYFSNSQKPSNFDDAIQLLTECYIKLRQTIIYPVCRKLNSPFDIFFNLFLHLNYK